ncbi:Cytochrome b-c1 complex subunit 2, mitochondrial [Beauveria bassiana]|uniref:Cytochrome b-c1 complex subunit 2, mitochondrial n=1 Tax=Beauveria bassiana TaxID=176275 RepID=A0A2N6NJN5_BEABA|nr:Cytochrome b-c1 complex subunit 2, mitochondrial [Beauveria bassiana]
MISRSFLARNAQQAARRFCSVRPTQQRGFAAAASAGAFEATDANGLKVASRETHGPTTKLAIVAKAGTRYQPLPGLTCVALSAVPSLMRILTESQKNTQKRSGLRIYRESELLGGQLTASHTREALVVGASFLKDNLPYFAELLAEVVTQTKYTTHEFHEDVERVLHLRQAINSSNVPAIALDNAHAVAFHTGLGAPLTPYSAVPAQKYLNEEHVASYADAVYTKPNIAIVAEGANTQTLSRWVSQFFKDVPASSQSGQSLKAEATKYFGGEQRIANPAGNSMVVAFPGSDINASKPEIAVLASLLGNQPSIKWSPGFSLLSKAAAATPGLSASASSLAYSDAGLLAIQLTGAAASVRKGAEDAVKALKAIAQGSVSKDDVSKAVANAKFDALDKAQLRDSSILLAGNGIISNGKPLDIASIGQSFDAVNVDKLKTVAKTLLDGKATVSTVGDLFVLPYAEEIGLRV